jgi:hypothetical protein
MDNTKISKALLELGYSEFVVRGDTYEGIEWIVEPSKKPTIKEIEDMAKQLDSLKEAEQTAKAEAKASAMAKLAALGLSEEEVQAIIGA